MPISPELLEVHEYTGPGYLPLVDYGAWRVALMRYSDELRPERLTFVERHRETDEVFVLLVGRCILFLLDEAGELHPCDLQPKKIYNVKRGVYHTHTLNTDAMVLVVENRDTDDTNSDKIPLTAEQRTVVLQAGAALFPER
ncbi:MAG: hypothetical protein Fur0018_24750 [Anaerolineales bacterium]